MLQFKKPEQRQGQYWDKTWTRKGKGKVDPKLSVHTKRWFNTILNWHWHISISSL